MSEEYNIDKLISWTLDKLKAQKNRLVSLRDALNRFCLKIQFELEQSLEIASDLVKIKRREINVSQGEKE